VRQAALKFGFIGAMLGPLVLLCYPRNVPPSLTGLVIVGAIAGGLIGATVGTWAEAVACLNKVWSHPSGVIGALAIIVISAGLIVGMFVIKAFFGS
jgi:hypothetical protein